MSNEIEDILEEDEEVIEEETPDEPKTEAKKGKMDLSYLDKDPSEWTTDDAANAQKATKTLQFQKKHFQEKAKTNKETKVEAKPLITNTEQPINVLEEMDKRFLKNDGVTDEDLDQLKFIQAGLKAQGKEVTLMEAQSNPLYKAYQETKVREAKKVNAQLISNGSGVFKDGKEMSAEERAAAQDEKAKELLNQM